MKHLAVANQADGRLEVFAAGEGLELKHILQTTPNGPAWRPWQGLGRSSDTIAVGKNRDGSLELFAIGAQGDLWHRRQVRANGSWDGWRSLGGSIDQLAVESNEDGRLEVFARGLDRTLHHISQKSCGSKRWSGWQKLGGVIERLAVGQNRDGYLQVFAIGSDHALWHIRQKDKGRWSAWASEGGWADQLAVARDAEGRLTVFTRGQDRTLRYLRQRSRHGSHHWETWQSLGGDINQIAVGRNRDGSLEVFTLGPDRSVRHIWQAGPGGRWGGWASEGGWADQLAVGGNRDGRLEIFARGRDRSLNHKWQTVANGHEAWSPWSSLGGAIVDGPSMGGSNPCGAGGCVCGSLFGIGLVQSKWFSAATHKNFEVVVPHDGGGFSHYWRENNRPPTDKGQPLPWHGPGVFGSGDVNGVALIQSNLQQGNLEVVATVGNQLVHHWRADNTTWEWSPAFTIATGVKGQPALVQSNHGLKGNFEVVVPLSSGGLAHFWRDNDDPGQPWIGPTVFGTGRTYDAVAMIQSRYGVGNLEVVARSGAELWAFWRDDGPALKWNGPNALNGPAISAVGTHDFLQGSHGMVGNFEMVVPLATGGLAHYWRDNDDPNQVWRGPAMIDSTAAYSAASVIFSDYGHLEVVARKVDGTMVSFFRDDTAPWAWHPVGGAFTSEPCCDPVTSGKWDDPLYSDMVGIHAVVLPQGKVLFFGFQDKDATKGQSELFDPMTAATEKIDNPPDLFCSGHTLLPNGRAWVSGGHHHDTKSTHTFDPLARSWIKGEPMPEGRWYPTTAVLPDGQAFTISGSKTGGPNGGDPKLNNNSWQAYHWPSGTLSAPHIQLPSPFSTDGFAAVDLYPFVYVLPNGRLMVHSRQTTRFLDPVMDRWDPVSIPTVRAYSRTYPAEGTSVLLTLSPADGYRARVMVMGGGGDYAGGPQNLAQGDPATDTTEMIDLGATTPAWQPGPSLSFPRVLPDSVLLPDGRVFVTGGSAHGKADNATDPVLVPEIYDPAANSWSKLCPSRAPRLYHSTALLLPDARVLAAGRDGLFNADSYNWPEHRVEIYSPPYLFAGTRPNVDLAPETATYGSTFSVNVSSVAATNITRAVLITPGSVTHSFNQNQRAVQLEILTASTGTLTLRGPPNPSVAPPGYYMLFLVSNQGVPSRAVFIRLT